MFSSRIYKILSVYVVAAACVIWVLRGVQFGELRHQIGNVDLVWIPLAMVLDIVTTLLHGLRWRLLLEPVGQVPLIRTVQAIYTGLFTNEILPLKAGEVVRGYVQARFMDRPLSAVLPSMMTERIMDGFLLVSALLVSAIFVDLPGEIAKAGLIAGIIVILVIAGMILLAFLGKQPADSALETLTGRWKPMHHITTFFSQMSLGIRSMRHSVRFLPVIGLSILYFLSQAVAYWIVMHAYGLIVPVWTPLVVLVVVRIGAAVPGAPANIGPFQFFCVMALSLFGIDKTPATGVAILITVTFMAPIFVLGFLAFAKSGMTLSKARSVQAFQAKSRKQRGPVL